MSNALCTPAKAGAAAGAATGVVVWLLVSFVPAFHNGVPEAVVALIPVALGWLGHVAGTWLTPHPAPKPAPAPAPVVAPGTHSSTIVTALPVTGNPAADIPPPLP